MSGLITPSYRFAYSISVYLSPQDGRITTTLEARQRPMDNLSPNLVIGLLDCSKPDGLRFGYWKRQIVFCEFAKDKPRERTAESGSWSNAPSIVAAE